MCVPYLRQKSLSHLTSKVFPNWTTAVANSFRKSHPSLSPVKEIIKDNACYTLSNEILATIEFSSFFKNLYFYSL